jgi:FKBP-type peptidyl-prolyl cis-trans isomerase SlyD
MSETATVTADTVVVFDYVLESNEGQTLESSEGEPLVYLHGHENLVPGLERQLEGRSVGDKFVAIVEPADGYGERSDEEPVAVPADQFPADLTVEPGMQFSAEDDDGNEIPVWVLAVESELILVDPNHPLAGQILHFQIEIHSIRSATDEEKANGHPHGEGGESED